MAYCPSPPVSLSSSEWKNNVFPVPDKAHKMPLLRYSLFHMYFGSFSIKNKFHTLPHSLPPIPPPLSVDRVDEQADSSTRPNPSNVPTFIVFFDSQFRCFMTTNQVPPTTTTPPHYPLTQSFSSSEQKNLHH